MHCSALLLKKQGDEFAIARTVPYTPSPALWTELQPLPNCRGVPDGGSGPAQFRYLEDHHRFFNDHHPYTPSSAMVGLKQEDDAAQSLLPYRTGLDQHNGGGFGSIMNPRRFFSTEARLRGDSTSTAPGGFGEAGMGSATTGRRGYPPPGPNLSGWTASSLLDSSCGNRSTLGGGFSSNGTLLTPGWLL